MRVPSLPIVIDEFPALLDRHVWSRSGNIDGDRSASGELEVFFLTHFHTDHMKGLSSTWSAGIIITGTLTRQLLLSKFEGLRGRVLGLPFWCRTPLLSAGGTAHSAGESFSTTADSVVYVTLLPAFHIPGSAMIYLETPSNVTYLHTGDFKYTEALAHMSPLRTFFQSHRVDHLYLDDTWLHLGHVELTSWPTCTHRPAIDHRGAGGTDNGIRVLSKLLDTDQLEEAIEAIGRRMDYQRQLHTHWLQQQQQQRDNSTAMGLSSDRLPFVVRVYLHNQFGKEMLVQQLAMRLRTRALIDDTRYARLLTVVEALEEERDDLETFKGASLAPLDGTVPPLSAEELSWRASGGEAAYYPYNLNYFVSFAQAQHDLQAQLQQGKEQHQRLASLSHGSAALLPHPPQPTAGCAVKRLCEPPLIEVVSSRASIAPTVLQRASAERGGTPYYGVVISGWARLQSQTRGPAASGQVWHVPTTLHSTPQEIVDFVSLIRPLSATPLHYRPSRGDVVMQRLGPYLRMPFVNQHDTGYDSTTVSTAGSGAVRWMPCLPAHLLSSQLESSSYSQVYFGASPLSVMLGTRDPAAVCGDGLESLEEKPWRGFRIGPARLAPLTSHGVVVAASRPGGEAPVSRDSLTAAITTSYFFTPPPPPTSTTSLSDKGVPRVCDTPRHPTDIPVTSSAHVDVLRVPQLLPPWRMRHLTQSYLHRQQSGRKRGRDVGEVDGLTSVTHRAERCAATAMKAGSYEEGVEAVGDKDRDCAVVPLNGSATPARLGSLSDIVELLLA
ncbi:hypothetical protein JKF63_06340 [Porcisia hertigi]|uniref:Uncharacterized protein n=1 Tax=Porcisia hertigi TaxID=2761500 RepID=A0A836IYV8_9TRYP|nr:hypothetical protein JKF63_06340 [Porcisia hertigi]